MGNRCGVDIVVASTSDAKIAAVTDALFATALFNHDKTIWYPTSTVEGTLVESGVPEQPYGDPEILKGAHTRLDRIASATPDEPVAVVAAAGRRPRRPRRRILVSIESGIVDNVMPSGETRYFDKTWVVVKDGNITVATHTLGVEVPAGLVVKAKEKNVTVGSLVSPESSDPYKKLVFSEKDRAGMVSDAVVAALATLYKIHKEKEGTPITTTTTTPTTPVTRPVATVPAVVVSEEKEAANVQQ